MAFGIFLFPFAHGFKPRLLQLFKFEALYIVFIIQSGDGLLIYLDIIIIYFLAFMVGDLPGFDVQVVHGITRLLYWAVEGSEAFASVSLPSIFHRSVCMAVIIISTTTVTKSIAKIFRSYSSWLFDGSPAIFILNDPRWHKSFIPQRELLFINIQFSLTSIVGNLCIDRFDTLHIGSNIIVIK